MSQKQFSESSESDHKLTSCGFLIMRREPSLSFLLMKHANRWDLPKGHVDPGETELVCAFRELEEETGIKDSDIQRDLNFRFTTSYYVQHKRTKGRRYHKTLIVFLAWLNHAVEIRPTEHSGFEWFDWQPPHRIQKETIDDLLAAVAKHLA